MSDAFILTISPAQPCMGDDPDTEQPCNLLTTLAEAERESGCERQLSVHPYCWRHLYIGYPERDEGPTPEELEMLHFCVRNAVVGHFGGKGEASVLGTCPVDSIPAPYEPLTEDDYEEGPDRDWFLSEHAPDEAFYCT